MPPKRPDGKPKMCMSSYAFFVHTCRETHKELHPGENLVFSEFTRKCSDIWMTMAPKEKKRFEDMAEKDKVRYNREMDNYQPPKDPNAPKRALMTSNSSYSDTDRHRGEQGPRHQTAWQQQVHSMPTGGESVSRKHPLDVSASKPGDGKRARQEPKPSRRPPGAKSSSASGTSHSGNRGIRSGAESSSVPAAVPASRKEKKLLSRLSGYLGQMASTSSYLDTVRANSVLKQLLKPHELIEGLMRLDQSSGKPQEALLEQVEVARGLRKLTWLRQVANEANEVQFHSRAWIEDHIAKLKPIQQQASVSTKRTKDYQADTRPRVEHQVDVVASTKPLDMETESLSSGEEDRLLGIPMKEDWVPTALPGSQRLLSGYFPVGTADRCATDSSPEKSECTFAEVLATAPKHKSPPPKPRSSTGVVKPCGSSPRKLNSRPSVAPRQLRRESQEQALYTDTGESTSTSGARHGDKVRPPGAESSSASGTSCSGKRGILSDAESSSVPATVPASRKDRKLLCPISGCLKPYTYPKKHAYALHIPGIFKEGLNLETATPKRIKALRLATTWLLGTRATIMELASYVEQIDLLGGLDNRGMTSAQTKPMGALCSAMNLEVPEQFTVCPLNSPAALLHWRALNLVISQLEPNQRHNFMEQFPDTGARTPENLEDVDELPIRRAVPVRDDRSAEDITEDDLKRVANIIKEEKKDSINYTSYGLPPFVNKDESSNSDNNGSSQEDGESVTDVDEVDVWCSCGNCTSMPSTRESKCCRDTNLLKGKMSEANIECITEHEGFQVNCLNHYVLETSYYEYLEENGQPDQFIHELYRDLAYRRFVRWIYQILGKNNCRVLPSCVVKSIRDKFPSQQYCGFKYPN